MSHIHPSVYVADTAFVAGNVTVGEDSSIWPGASLRADFGPIVIGRGTSVQDNCSIHLQPANPVTVGDLVTLGHGAVLHGCTIGNHCVVGMNATVLDGAVVGDRSIVAAGAVVKGGLVIPENSLVVGMSEIKEGRVKDVFIPWFGALMYIALARMYKQGQTEFNPDAIIEAAEPLKEIYPIPQ